MRGQKRARAISYVPKHVEKRRGMWVYRPWLGVVDGKRVFGKRVVLCSLNAPTSDLFKAYDRATGKVGDTMTVSWLLSQYQKSPHVKALASSADYEDYMRLLCGYPTLDGRTLGEQPLTVIKKTTIRKYLDTYKDGQHPIAANRHVQYLKAAWNYMAQRDDRLPPNPCEKVTLNKSGIRDRYVTDAQMAAYKALCSSRSYLPMAMELAYLCRLRANEVYAIQAHQIEPAGLRVFRGKGSKGEITAWNARLRGIVDACLAWNAEITCSYLLHDKHGMPYTMSNHKSQWQRLQAKATKNKLERFTFHDLKAKGYSDQKIQDAGHMSPKMHKVYDRKGRLVEGPNGELDFDA